MHTASQVCASMLWLGIDVVLQYLHVMDMRSLHVKLTTLLKDQQLHHTKAYIRCVRGTSRLGSADLQQEPVAGWHERLRLHVDTDKDMVSGKYDPMPRLDNIRLCSVGLELEGDRRVGQVVQEEATTQNAPWLEAKIQFVWHSLHELTHRCSCRVLSL